MEPNLTKVTIAMRTKGTNLPQPPGLSKLLWLLILT